MAIGEKKEKMKKSIKEALNKSARADSERFFTG